MSFHSVEQIDEIAEAFESQWSAETAGVKGIAAFLASRPDVSVQAPELLTNLIQVDLERAWLSWNSYVTRLAQSLPVDELIRRRTTLPQLEQYAQLFDGLESFRACLPELAEVESRCREHWGDAIGSLHYQHQWGLTIPATQSSIPRLVTCIYDESLGQLKKSWPLNGRCTFGRRRSADPQWNIVQAQPDGNRYLIADRSDANISREQLEIWLLTRSHVLLKNTSLVCQAIVSGKVALQPNTQRVISLPFSVRLPGRKLVFE